MRKIVVMSVALVVGAQFAGASALGAAKKTPTKKTLTVTMTGKQETPKGSPTGSGTARLTLDSAKGRICFNLSWSKIKAPVAAHIHKGAKGKAGPIVVPLFTSAPAKHTGCVSATKSVVAAIIKKPGGYYVNVHTSDFPGSDPRTAVARKVARPAPLHMRGAPVAGETAQLTPGRPGRPPRGRRSSAPRCGRSARPPALSPTWPRTCPRSRSRAC